MTVSVVPAPPLGAPPRKRSTRRFAFQFPQPPAHDEREGRPDEAWSLPSFLISCSVHVVLIVVVAMTFLRGGGGSPFGRGGKGDPGEMGGGGAIEATFSVGTPGGAVSGGAEGTDNGEEGAVVEAVPAAAPFRQRPGSGLTEAPPEIDRPPVELPTAQTARKAPGKGTGRGFVQRDEIGSMVRAGGFGRGLGGAAEGDGVGGGGGDGAGGLGKGRGRGEGNGIGHGAVGFFGLIQQKSYRVVFVVDRSSSMGNHNALNHAKRELMASVESLEPAQAFQILFFHEAVTPLRIEREKKGDLYPATRNNKNLVAQFLTSIQADMGTKRFPALKQALELQPETIFFLTDADEAMSSKEVIEIQKLSRRSKTRIHVIEFGQGAPLPRDDNFLKQLARNNGGSYRYQDVLQFDRN